MGVKIILGVIKEEEREKYLAVSYEYSYMKGAYKDERFVETTWKEFLSDASFVCSIYEKETSEYVGYYSIKNLSKCLEIGNRIETGRMPQGLWNGSLTVVDAGNAQINRHTIL